MISDDDLRSVVDRLPDGILVVGPDLKVVYANPAARRVFHPEALRVGGELPRQPLEPDFESFVRGLFHTKTGPVERNLAVASRTLRVVGIPPFRQRLATVVVEDVSAKTRRDHARTEFVANAAHELLTPLTGIVSAAHVLESGAKEDPEIRDRFLHHISRECNRLVRVARSLLTLARAQAGEQPPILEIIEVGPLLEDALSAGPMLGAVEVQCPDGVAVFVDRDLAETALANLLANAVRHASDGVVSVTVELPVNHMVGIEIANLGRDVGAADAERMQRRFVSAAGRDGGGYGLGISIAAQALDTIGGTLAFDSNGAEGTRARVELPAAKA